MSLVLLFAQSLILSWGISEHQPVRALFSRDIITCTHGHVTLSMPSPSSGRLNPPFLPSFLGGSIGDSREPVNQDCMEVDKVGGRDAVGSLEKFGVGDHAS